MLSRQLRGPNKTNVPQWDGLTSAVSVHFSSCCLPDFSSSLSIIRHQIEEIITPFSTRLWQFNDNGRVVSVSSRPSGDVCIVVERSGSPVNGEKFTTLHGQKGVVTIVDDNMMPSVHGTVADIVISSGSIVK